jgi:hypothetical protein
MKYRPETSRRAPHRIRERMLGMSSDPDTEFTQDVRESPESFSNGMGIVTGTVMIETAGAASGPIIAGWLLFNGARERPGGDDELEDARVRCGCRVRGLAGITGTVDVRATMPDIPAAAHRGLAATKKMVRGAYALEGEAAAKAAGAGRQGGREGGHRASGTGCVRWGEGGRERARLHSREIPSSRPKSISRGTNRRNLARGPDRLPALGWQGC